MRYPRLTRTVLGGGLMLGTLAAAATAMTMEPSDPVAVKTAKVTIAGTSNVHDYTSETTTVRVTRVQTTAAGPALWDDIVKPGALEGFDIAVPVATLKSGKDGLDKNLYKALLSDKHPDITFRLTKLEPAAAGMKATGTLRVAGVERSITFDITTQLTGGAFLVKGSVPLVMTDYGIAPPKAMLGMLKTDPKVTITFELTLAAAELPLAR